MKSKHSICSLIIVLIICLSMLAGTSSLSQAKLNGEGNIYLPLIIKNFPITPLSPTLNSINNEDGNGSYSVIWNPSDGANTYTLQEDTNANFLSSSDIYEGPGTSIDVNGKDMGTYYYRVKASNGYASSEWSNIVSVAVTEALPDCPQAGAWRGTTSQNERVYFSIQNTPQCQIESGSLSFGWDTYGTGCYYDAYTTFNVPLEISNDQFNASNISTQLDELTGTFTSPNLVEGIFSVSYTVTTPYIRSCTASGTWDAQPIHGVNGDVYAIHVLNDGDILIGGSFSLVNQTEQINIARLNPDGTLDQNFNTDVNAYVYSITQQADGKILIGGSITEINGQAVQGIARLNEDGSLDSSFDPAITRTDSALNPRVHDMVILTDGDILVGGEFNEVDGQERNYIARLNPDGSLDASFNANLHLDSSFIVNSIAVDGDMVLIAGEFVAGDWWTGPHNLTKVSLEDGSLDESFAADIVDLTVWEVKQIKVQSDNKIIVLHANNIIRLNQDGTNDSGFSVPALDAFPETLAILDNGKILVGGWFSDHLIQLESNGTQTSTFNPDPNNSVLALVIQSNGKILIGGEFSKIGEAVRHGIARLNTDGSIDPTFDPNP